MNRVWIIVAILLPWVATLADQPGLAAASSDRAYYVSMRDGVRIAMNVYFPGGREPVRRSPAVLIQTRYGRAGLGSWQRTRRWLDDGVVVAVIDTRGSTASFGTRVTEFAPEEIADVDDVVKHLVSQSWSDGRVFVAGQSYSADAADLATSRPIPEIVGGVIHESEFDVYAHLIAPGGVMNRGFLAEWGAVTRNMDLGRGGFDLNGPARDCRVRVTDCAALYPVLQPVDDDRDFTQLRAALAGKQRWLPEDLLNVSFRDDKGHNGYGLFDMSPAGALEGVRRKGAPVQYWGSWMDGGTAESVLARYRTLPTVPMEVWITANDHNNFRNADPFSPDVSDPRPSLTIQLDLQSRFVRDVLAGRPLQRQIHYYVLGADEFRTTTAWPVPDAKPFTFHFASKGRMAERPENSATDGYDVDASLGTGQKTRWSTQIGIPPAYQDRREIDRRLLAYDSDPVSTATEIVGTPVVTLVMTSSTDDPAVFTYLEDIAPDGRVTYLTEGIFRAIHRRPASATALPYDQGPAAHSFWRRDAELVSPGETFTLEFPMMPTAALLRPGHRLRLAIAGADADWFTVYSQGKPGRFDVRVGAEGSKLTVPVRLWR